MILFINIVFTEQFVHKYYEEHEEQPVGQAIRLKAKRNILVHCLDKELKYWAFGHNGIKLLEMQSTFYKSKMVVGIPEN